MKDGIHPNYVDTQVTCGCGNTFTTRSTREELKVDICNVCHPFFTGKQKLIDTEGRVERFTKKYGSQTVAGLKARMQKRGKPAAPSAPEAEPTPVE